MNQDGCSLITFYSKTREWDTTVLLVEDEHGWKFGGYCTEAWRQAGKKFFGSGQNLLFSFEGLDDPMVYMWGGSSDQHMYGDDKSIGLGGSKQEGRFAFYLHSNLYRGSSYPVESYSNQQPLSKKEDFKCYKLEVWALEY